MCLRMSYVRSSFFLTRRQRRPEYVTPPVKPNCGSHRQHVLDNGMGHWVYLAGVLWLAPVWCSRKIENVLSQSIYVCRVVADFLSPSLDIYNWWYYHTVWKILYRPFGCSFLYLNGFYLTRHFCIFLCIPCVCLVSLLHIGRSLCLRRYEYYTDGVFVLFCFVLFFVFFSCV